MHPAVRVIPCLDVRNGRVVKGINFRNLTDAGDPVERAKFYAEEGADEIIFLDVSASVEERAIRCDMVRRTAESLFIPLTVGGGVRSVFDVEILLRNGADKISVNTAAVSRPKLIDEIVSQFGSQVCVVSVDAERNPGVPSGFSVATHGGQKKIQMDAIDWVRQVEGRGAGEILLNSIDADGTNLGFDVEMITAVRKISKLPLIASGGAGEAGDAVQAYQAGADAVLAASIFHQNRVSVRDVKAALSLAGARIR